MTARDAYALCHSAPSCTLLGYHLYAPGRAATRGAQACGSPAHRCVLVVQVGGMMQMDGSVKFGNSESGPDTSKYAF